MKKNSTIFLLALFPLIPAASRLANGLILSTTFIWFFVIGILLKTINEKLQSGGLGHYMEMAGIAASSVIFNNVLRYFFPVIASSFNFYIHLSAFSTILLISIDSFSSHKINKLPLLHFLPGLILLSVCRELASFGSLSIPTSSGFYTFLELPNYHSWGIPYWGTTSGSLILLGVITWVIRFSFRKLSTNEDVK